MERIKNSQKLKRNVFNVLLALVLTLLPLSLPIAIFAAWSTNTAENNPISTVADDQQSSQLVSDGSGGAIITWQDHRSGSNNDIYAQRVNASGVVLWTNNGTAISTAAGDQVDPQLVSDGSGGAIITWQDFRSGTNNDIYAQRVNASGVVQWTNNGTAISTAGSNQEVPQIIDDGSGGAIITWQDDEDEGFYNIYAQRVNASGAVQWMANGVAISTAANNQESPQLVTDGSAGAIITWHDYRSGSSYDLYARRVNAAGSVLWTADGVAISTAANNQYRPQLVDDGSGGAIITWQDYRVSTASSDLYAQRVDAAGGVLWTNNGTAISTAANAQGYVQLLADGSGGAILTWHDLRNGNYDIYAQRVNAAGSALWTNNGTAISTAAGTQGNPQLVPDGSGGAVITWYDNHSGNYDI